MTAALLKDPDSAETAMFSVVKAGGKILPHCGPWNTRLTVHCGSQCAVELCYPGWRRGSNLGRGYDAGVR